MAIVLPSCKDMLDTNSNTYLNTDDNLLQSANDSLYSVIGIVQKMEQLGERYVALGELRGDLMDVTKNASMDLQAVADFTATADNPYLSTKEYYAVINNCNYYLQHVDTSIVSAGRKVMLGEYALVKTLRAWTYLQLGLNFGKVFWIEEPVLTIDDMNRQYPEISVEELVPRLISDIEPFVGLEDYPSYGSINGLSINASLIPVPVMLAELTMWNATFTGSVAEYEKAARLYYHYFTTSSAYRACTQYNQYYDSEFKEISGASTWFSYFTALNETVSCIRYNYNFSESPVIPPLALLCLPSNMSDTYKVQPSQAAISLWNNEIYAFYRSSQKDVVYNYGDLRGNPGSTMATGSYSYASTNEADSLPYITKYGYLRGSSANILYFVNLFREGKMYLRYAEALNMAGKPSLAFAVLKYGLKYEVLTDPAKVSPDEITPFPDYCDFTSDTYSTYSSNRGLHSRGCGNVDYDTVYYAFTPETLNENRAYYGFPETLDTKTDSMQFVNVMICKELGLETAFEGNRFHDLMRLSKVHERLTGKSDFLARWVGRKNPALEAKLENQANWFLPFK
jgi:hypothetical protein